MIRIKLTQGKYALIDNKDLPLVSKYKWCVHKNRTGIDKYYAVHSKKHIRMHRIILGLTNANKVDVDHINGNGLDNRRSNLRICSRKQNCGNRRKQKRINGTGLSSKYLGVCYDKSRHKWLAYINCDGQRKHLGRFNTEKDAALKYNEVALHTRKEFASLNTVED